MPGITSKDYEKDALKNLEEIDNAKKHFDQEQTKHIIREEVEVVNFTEHDQEKVADDNAIHLNKLIKVRNEKEIAQHDQTIEEKLLASLRLKKL